MDLRYKSLIDGIEYYPYIYNMDLGYESLIDGNESYILDLSCSRKRRRLDTSDCVIKRRRLGNRNFLQRGSPLELTWHPHRPRRDATKKEETDIETTPNIFFKGQLRFREYDLLGVKKTLFHDKCFLRDEKIKSDDQIKSRKVHQSEIVEKSEENKENCQPIAGPGYFHKLTRKFVHVSNADQ